MANVLSRSLVACRGAYPISTAMAMALLIGCSDGGGRSPTAPEPPVPFMNAACSEIDNGADGTIDVTYTYTYDAAGFLVGYEGVPTDKGKLEYDADHFLLRHTSNMDADPEPEYQETYTRDAQGRILTSTELVEGASTVTRENRYDAAGRRIRSVETLTQITTMGTTTSTTTADYTYTGDELNPTSAQVMYPEATSAFTYTTSPDRRSLHLDMDDGVDGTIDRTQDTMFDGERRPLSQIERANAVLRRRSAWTYDGGGRMVSFVWADSEPGTPDDFVSAIVYDGDGMMTQRSVRSPSGQYASAAYDEILKDQCATPSGNAARVRPARSALLREAGAIAAP